MRYLINTSYIYLKIKMDQYFLRKSHFESKIYEKLINFSLEFVVSWIYLLVFRYYYVNFVFFIVKNHQCSKFSIFCVVSRNVLEEFLLNLLTLCKTEVVFIKKWELKRIFIQKIVPLVLKMSLKRNINDFHNDDTVNSSKNVLNDIKTGKFDYYSRKYCHY